MTEAREDGHRSLGSFDHTDLEAWLVSGDAGRLFVDELRVLLRAQLLSAAIGSSFGLDVERGLYRQELGAALALAARPSRDWGEHQAKRAALRARTTSRSASDFGTAMIRTALLNDARHLERLEALSSGVAGASAGIRTPPRRRDQRGTNGIAADAPGSAAAVTTAVPRQTHRPTRKPSLAAALPGRA